MNSKILLLTSLLIATVCHLVFFNAFTIVFPIDPAAPKPKFFFLGPILNQSDFRQNLSKEQKSLPHEIFRNTRNDDNTLGNIDSGSTDQTNSPFSIQTIKKPLFPQATESQNKVVIKSTFETDMQEGINTESATQKVDPIFQIKPYRSLQFHPPKNN